MSGASASGTSRAERIGRRLIRAACRRLPADVRNERCREWDAELPAILGDQSIRPAFLRVVRALAFSAGISRAARQLSRPARAGARRTRNAQWRAGNLPTGPKDIVGRVIVGVVAEIVVVASFVTLAAVLATGPDPHPWPLLIFAVLGIAFDGFCLADIARSAGVRYLSKWMWALCCLIQIPLGGILYLSVGRSDPHRPVPRPWSD